MDLRLFQAAQSGSVDGLKQLLNENPFILHSIATFSAENPLHLASIAGHVEFVKEIIRLKPDFANQVNQFGLTPMHMAAANGYVEIVKELMNINGKLCQLKGRDGMTPFHFAASNSRVEVIDIMLSGCPDCIQDMTTRRETALHIAVKNYQIETVRKLVDWIAETNKEDFLNMKDAQGNTVLHLATQKKQLEVIELLLENGSITQGSLDVNATNNSNLTALDMLLMFPSEAGDTEIFQILAVAGATTARNSSNLHNHFNHNLTSPSTADTSYSQTNNLVDYFKFKKGIDSPSEARSALLIVASLVATATFQVGANPPGGCWQDTYFPEVTSSSSNSNKYNTSHIAGLSILATRDRIAFSIFVFFNTIGFTISLFMVSILTRRFPLELELNLCMTAIYCSYNTALINISPDSIKLYVILTVTILSAAIPVAAMKARQNTKKIGEFFVKMFRRAS